MKDLFLRLKFAHKLLICSTAFALPLAVLLYYAVSGFERQIAFTAREITGARALESLCKLALVLDKREPNAQAATDALFSEVRTAESELGPLLPGSQDAAGVHAAFPRLAENANLILDPDLDSYYLADLTLLRLPPIYEKLSRDPAAALDESNLDAVRHGIFVAVSENRRKNPGGSPLATNLLGAMAKFESPGLGSDRRQAAAGLWQAGIAELGVLLRQRSADLRRKELIGLVLTLAAAGFAGILLLTVVRNVSTPLVRATGIADQIAAGRLGAATQSLSQPEMQEYGGARISGGNGRTRDETFRLLSAFSTMAQSLESLLHKVRSSCSQLDGSTAQLAAALREVEATVTEQAASTNQVVATTNEIFATVQKLAQDMRTVMSMAGEAASLASAGLAELSGINAAMQDTLEGVGSVSSILDTISEKAVNINCVLGAITNIANRTNLISLNAAIEAEKAGEHAAGFAAVGLEIRRVADQTAVAALDIEKMLGGMQTAVSQGTRSMAAYAERSRANSETVASITAGMARSIEYTRKLEPHFEAVNDGMQTQAEAARQILEAMHQLSATAAQTRDSLAQFREVAEHMRATVGVLQGEIARFSVA